MAGRLIRGLLLALGIAWLYFLTSRTQRFNRAKVARWYRTRPEVPKRRIVVLGAGFGGLYTTMHLADALRADPRVEITLVDRNNFHLFTPLLTTVAGGLVDSQHVAYPVRRLERTNTFLFRESNVIGIDLDKKMVRLEDGHLTYDYLVFALGSVTNFFGMKNVERLAFPFKNLRDAVRVRNEVISRFEEAIWESDPARRRQLLTFVFCGGGATGVELAAAVHDFIFESLIEEHPGVERNEVRLVLVEAHRRLLPTHDPYLSIVTHNKLLSKGVDVRLGTRIASPIEDDSGRLTAVETHTGEIIPTRTLIWTAGIEVSDVISTLPVQKGRGGAIMVDEYLGVPGYQGVYALGDNAAARDPRTGVALSPDAKVAVQLARWVAKNIVNEMNGRPRVQFKYEHMGDLVLLGTNAAVADIKGVKLSGLPAFLLWRSFYFWRLLGFESKARIAWDYLYGLLAERDTAKTEVA
ncbi:MAG: NAD(P)/FAD-dependent oxidoreductase [Chloroflexi bacterium]|nr:NAD(P)/FAD-dependent oxidoreductase [Chloroflexota bacterium]